MSNRAHPRGSPAALLLVALSLALVACEPPAPSGTGGVGAQTTPIEGADGGSAEATDAAVESPEDGGSGGDLSPAVDSDIGACRPGEPLAEAFEPGGPLEGGGAIIPGGRKVTPAGTIVQLGRAPIGLALSPDGQRAYVTCDGDSSHALQVIDIESGQIVQELRDFEAFRGVAASPDGARVVVAAGASGRLLAFDVSAEDGSLSLASSIDLAGYLGALTLSADGSVAYVASNTASLVFEVDLSTMELQRSFPTANFPYDVLADPWGERLYVSNLGSSTVSVIELAAGEVLAELETPRGPEDLILDLAGERLFVACADDDSILVVDTETLQPEATFDLSHHPEGLLAASPNDLALSPDGGTLFAVQADLNQTDLVDALTGELRGALPSGWYPVAVEAHPDDERLVVLNAKGFGANPGSRRMPGLLQIVPLPADEEALAAETQRALDNNARPGRFYASQCATPLPAGADGKLPIEHVVLIVRENKTYDMVLGDLEGANGDPELVLFGEDITPNLHALARRFVSMDNFHSDPEVSLQGHLWTTQADCNDFVEKLRHTQLPAAGYEPASMAGGGSIFEHCLEHGVSFRNYGEVTSFGPELMGRMRDFIDPKFPFYNMDVRDEAKAREVIREWSLGIFPQFIYIGLPNDHTYGTRPGKPTPESMVADNDRATGMLVEWLSESPYWDKTIVFIIEDDPQSYMGDHVDAHRSICVVASPWVKRGYVSHVHYSIPSIYKTIEMLLGLPPMNKNDAGAAPMYDIFIDPSSDEPEREPFGALPLAVPHAENPENAPMAAESEALGWHGGVDGMKGLGRILWHARKGDIEPPAYAKGIDE